MRLATPDVVGNLVGYVYGPEQRVFYDDRFDMFPEDITEAARGAGAHPSAALQEHLDELDIDLVTVGRSPTAQVLGGSDLWRTLFLDESWPALPARRRRSPARPAADEPEPARERRRGGPKARPLP